MKRTLEALSVLLVSALFFSLFQPWGAFRDPDAFYHAKMSSLLLQHGVVTHFPWLDLTTLGQQFVDQHFLYHIVDAPFVFFFGMLPGHQVGSVFFAACFITTFFLILKWLRVSHAALWTVLLGVLPPMIARLNLGKASPLALLFFFLGLVAVMKRSWKALLVVMPLYVMTHGGWPLLFIILAAYFLGEVLYETMVREHPWKKLGTLFDTRTIKTILALFAGTLLGILIHPYRAGLLSFLQTQIFSIGVQTPFDQVILGIEWLPYPLSSFLFDFSLLWMMALVLLFGFLFARKAVVEDKVMRWGIALGLCAAVLFALTLKSRRFGEYMAPAFVLWFAVLGGVIDWRKMLQEFRSTEKYLQGLLMVFLVIAFGRGLWVTHDFFHMGERAFNRFVPALEVADQYLAPGDRLFHSNWAQFPELFAARDEYKYVAGLDPVFLLKAHPDLSYDYTALMTGEETVDPYDVIRNKFDSSVALYEQETDTKMIRRLKRDSRFHLLYEDDVAALFKLE